MGKRSDFKRIPKDFYRTIDPRAGQAFRPHVKEGYYFEPCCGKGDLIKQLDWLDCFWGSDIELGFDARDTSELDVEHADYIITNPPWERKILHELIEVFSNLRPTWLLFDSDWVHTKQSKELVEKYLIKQVSVGRLIWIPGTKVSGKDNCSWYFFHNTKNKDYVEFYGR